ncbi:MAG: hypothetical protein M1824_000690 [Vezdaea acicularis]|nr:MAG: hypothetical protein M1824_000690 [Vezdaea acicularis]
MTTLDLLDGILASSDAAIPILRSTPRQHSNGHKRKPQEISQGDTSSQQKKRKVVKKDLHENILNGINKGIGKMDGKLLADYVAQRMIQVESSLSAIESLDRSVPGRAIQDTSSWEKPRDLANFSAFLERFTPGKVPLEVLTTTPKENGSPHTLVITCAGLRAADLTRALRKFQTKDATVAKLFAKHIKLKDAVQYVKRARIGIAVGTPQRLADLHQNGALTLSNLRRIVVDASYVDQKRRGIMDMKETLTPLLTFLNTKELKDQLLTSGEGVALMFY